MTLPASGTLAASQINVELGRPSTALFTMGGAPERALAGVPSGTIAMSNFYGKTAGGGPAGRYASYLGNNGTGTGLPFGTAVAGRRLVAMINWSEGGALNTVSSVTIGGVAATIHVQRGHNGGGTGLGACIASAVVPTGTSGNVVVTYSPGGGITKQVGLVQLVGYTGAPAGTATDQTQTPTGTCSISLPSPGVADGVMVAAYTGSTLTSSNPITWSSAEMYDVNNVVRCGGSFQGTGGGITVTASQGAIANAGNDLVGLTWA